MSCQCYLAPIIAAPAHALAPSSTTDAWPLLSPSAATPPYSPWSSPVSRTPGTLRPHRYHCPALMPVLQRPVRASVHCESYITPSFPLPSVARYSLPRGVPLIRALHAVDSVGVVHCRALRFRLQAHDAALCERLASDYLQVVQSTADIVRLTAKCPAAGSKRTRPRDVGYRHGGEDLEPKAQGVGYPRAPASERAINSSGRSGHILTN